MRKVMDKLPQIDIVSIFSRKKKNGHKMNHTPLENDQEKLRVSARKTLKKYKKTFRKLAFE